MTLELPIPALKKSEVTFEKVLGAYKKGRNWWVTKEDLDNYIKENN